METRFFDAIDCDAEIVAYVRPQVDWFNAGWWQWWAWEDKFSRPEDVINAWGLHFMKWGARLRQWEGVPRVSKLTVRLHEGDVISDFAELLGIPGELSPTSDDRKNISLSHMMTKLYWSIPALRSPHGAEVDSILAPILQTGDRAPWIVNEALAETIVLGLAKDNESLLRYLSPEQAATMKADKRWWSSDAYGDRPVSGLSDLELSREECLSILSKVLSAYMGIDRRYRALK